MKFTALVAALLVAPMFSPAFAIDKVVYGDDNRLASFESSSQAYQKLARSTLAMIPKRSIELQFDALIAKISGAPLEEEMRLCKDERFTQTIAAANCSAFLVGPDLVATAGHCVRDLAECQSSYWVFDFRSDLALDAYTMNLSSESVYECSEIVSTDLSNSTMNDYALIRLDRPVIDRQPLAFRTAGKIQEGTALVVIGHPSGLPTIVSDGAWVRQGQNEHPYYFRANLDTFGGNSGSAVFNAETLEVEGILVRGETDYSYDGDHQCYRPYKCQNDECRAEDVTRITVIPELVPGMTPTAEEMAGFIVEDDAGQDDDFDFDFDFDFDLDWVDSSQP